MKFYINNRLSGEVDLAEADVADQFLAAVVADSKYILLSWGWPVERLLRSWLTDSDDGLGATWDDEAGFSRLFALAREAVGKLPRMRTAIVPTRRRDDGSHSPTAETVAKYLPSHYAVAASDDGSIIRIIGRDYAGWTMDGYVIPRLGSGLIYAEEER